MGLTIAALITASIVVVVGSISYIGLIVPNVVAMFKGDKIRGTLVDTALFGALFVLVCDMLGRVVIAPYELPIELIVGILGSLLFVGLLFYRLKTRAQGHPPQGTDLWLRGGRVRSGRRCGRMLTRAQRSNRKKLCIMAALVLLAAAAYMTVDVNFGNAKLLAYSMRIRAPKLLVMLITAFAIGGASLVFQSIINNTIVTPCLLGMNSLYTLIHTAVVFCVGSGSVLAANANAAFAIDLVLMGITATLIYSYLFKKTKHNVLYVLLVGTVLTSFFSSVQSTMTRVMDPQRVRHAADDPWWRVSAMSTPRSSSSRWRCWRR